MIWHSGLLSFNTTFVTVLFSCQAIRCTAFPWFQYNFCYCSIMLLLQHFQYVSLFQYNFCYCSIRKRFFLGMGSSVSIQLSLLFYQLVCFGESTFKSFNTTFVTVLSLIKEWQDGSNHCFNTTFVTVLFGQN